VPSYHVAYGPQAIQKGAEFGLGSIGLRGPAMFTMPNEIAVRLVGSPMSQPPQQRQQPPQQDQYSPNFHTEDKKLQKLLADPRMRSYLVNIISQR